MSGLDAGNWAEIFRAGRKNLPADHASPIVALGRALLAMEDKALEIGARHGEAPPTYAAMVPTTHPGPEADSRTRSSSAVRIIRVVKDGVDIERWVEPIEYGRAIYFARELVSEIEGSKILVCDNDNPDQEFGGWAEYNAAPYFPPEAST